MLLIVVGLASPLAAAAFSASVSTEDSAMGVGDADAVLTVAAERSDALLA
jgi:hypothetical protein